jgi:hypothetical protein
MVSHSPFFEPPFCARSEGGPLVGCHHGRTCGAAFYTDRTRATAENCLWHSADGLIV